MCQRWHGQIFLLLGGRYPDKFGNTVTKSLDEEVGVFKGILNLCVALRARRRRAAFEDFQTSGPCFFVWDLKLE